MLDCELNASRFRPLGAGEGIPLGRGERAARGRLRDLPPICCATSAHRTQECADRTQVGTRIRSWHNVAGRQSA